MMVDTAFQTQVEARQETRRQAAQSKRCWWFVGWPTLLEWWEADMMMQIQQVTNPRHVRLSQKPIRVNRLRGHIIEGFLEQTTNPLDTLIGLDIDHRHPKDVVNRLAAPDNFGVYMALTFKRSKEAPVAMAFDYPNGWDSLPVSVSGYEPGDVLECDRAGTAAFAVQRQVLQAIIDLGYGPYDIFEYKGGNDCDWHFAKLCSEAGFKHYVDTSIVSPHRLVEPEFVGPKEWDAWMKSRGQRGIVE